MNDDRPRTAAAGRARLAPMDAGDASTQASDRATKFSTFYRAELIQVVRFVMRIGATVAEATEAAQTAMVEAWRQWHLITNPRAWVRTVAKRAYYRSVPVREVVTDALPELSTVAADARLEISEETRTVLGWLAVLPVKQRLVLAWSLDGFTDEEIARELGSTRTAVRKNRQRARDALKHRLTQQECADAGQEGGR